MTAKQRDKDIKHWEKVIKKAENKPVTSDGRQQIYYAESRIDEIREEWRLSNVGQFSPPCSDFEVFSGNSDASCFRARKSYSKRLVMKDSSICNSCVYEHH